MFAFQDKIKQRVHWMGGIYSAVLTDDTTHLVSNTVLSDKYVVSCIKLCCLFTLFHHYYPISNNYNIAVFRYPSLYKNDSLHDSMGASLDVKTSYIH